MNAQTEKRLIAGPAGRIECALDRPAGADARGLALICHPNPTQGGTMDNKVVTTIARALVQRGWRVVRFDYRGVRESAGAWDEGRGEVDDALAVIAAHRGAGEPLVLGGFSFGGYVAASAAARLPDAGKARSMVLVAPSTVKHEAPPVIEDTLLIHGEADDVVPLSASMDWARPQALPVVVVPGAGHFFHGQLMLLKSLVLRNFAE